MKGIVLAGGSGSRLHPLTHVVTKQLLPIYNKPMIYYPISTLLSAGINDILIITTPEDIDLFKTLLGDGSEIGCKFSYAVQEKPEGLAQAFIIGETFIGDNTVALILGDNIFHGNLSYILNACRREVENTPLTESIANIFAYPVHDPERYGVIEISLDNIVVSVEEKPENPKTNLAIPGLYFYDNHVIEIAKTIKPSERGELEITAVNDEYLKRSGLYGRILPEGTAWLDTGTFESYMEAASYVETIEKRQGMLVGSIEATAYSEGYINGEQLMKVASKYSKNLYGKYLKNLLP